MHASRSPIETVERWYASIIKEFIAVKGSFENSRKNDLDKGDVAANTDSRVSWPHRLVRRSVSMDS